MKSQYLFILASRLCSAIAMADTAAKTALEVVPSIDVSRNMGKWYEVARLPNSFQNMCETNVTPPIQNGRRQAQSRQRLQKI
jgi:apolipoprotein D and lipocalin family protein